MAFPERPNSVHSAIGYVHLRIDEFFALPEEQRYCDRFDGSPIPRIQESYLRTLLRKNEVEDSDLYSYSLFLETNLPENILQTLEVLQNEGSKGES